MPENLIKRLGTPEIVGKIDVTVIKTKYEALLNHFEDSTILLDHLAYFGEAIFKNGIVAFVNPTDYEDLLNGFPKLRQQSIMPFAKTAMGNFYLIGEVDDEICLAFYNIHTEEYSYVDYEFSLFFQTLFANKLHMENEAYGHFEFPAVEQFGAVALDECLAFVPALVLDGEENINNIQKVNLKEQLRLLAQAFS
ncbi:T6SS immunity protein Tdi1 domain-containing protein [Flavobacterium cerinum]|uniref:DUF1851 domain-containing protein n=1 Tax=Flavobacterium cerinum TaxID=2502784 RepID=A0ABY5IR76_9FLAO|nr:T6SS immunity protein Tdi1 domain-containing protein [Flavobacterium cerinum]UUC43941.1 DUF1851 domain-containing protein [Flavobacterium cerinum]